MLPQLMSYAPGKTISRFLTHVLPLGDLEAGAAFLGPPQNGVSDARARGKRLDGGSLSFPHMLAEVGRRGRMEGRKGLCWGLRPPSPPYRPGKMCSAPFTPALRRSMSPCLRSQSKVGPPQVPRISQVPPWIPERGCVPFEPASRPGHAPSDFPVPQELTHLHLPGDTQWSGPGAIKNSKIIKF